MILLLILVLALIASASPLFTFTHLFQVKEWRLDRLQEHLDREGWFRQLFGVLRPVIVGIFVIVLVMIPDAHAASVRWVLLILAILSIAQIVTRKQPFPVWTQKAIGIIIIAFGLTFALVSHAASTHWIVVIPLLQPLFVFTAWLILLPVDIHLKNKIMKRAKALREQHPELTVIGVTGSVGKTTTKLLLAHILEGRKPLVTPEYVNAEIGVARWLINQLKKSDGSNEANKALEASEAIIELGAYRIGEIATLCDFVQPTMGIVTFVGTQHMALFGSEEKVCQAKSELVKALPETGHAFLNSDSALCHEIRNVAPCPVTTVGTGGHANVEAFDIEETSEGIAFKVGDTQFTVPLHGTHNVSNVLLAIGAAEKVGMDRRDIAARLRSFAPPQHTFAMRKSNDVTILDDTHNSSPMSFKAAIAWAKAQPIEHKTLLAAGLIELGSNQDRIHAELGGFASGVFDRVIFVSKQSASQFGQGYIGEVEIYSKFSTKILHNSLLVCVGRVTEKTIRQLLPNE